MLNVLMTGASTESRGSIVNSDATATREAMLELQNAGASARIWRVIDSTTGTFKVRDQTAGADRLTIDTAGAVAVPGTFAATGAITGASYTGGAIGGTTGVFSSTVRVQGGAFLRSGTGAPNGAVTGSVGDLWLRTDGGALTTLYVKESGANTNTGWVAK
jgi:hypothetical protein